MRHEAGGVETLRTMVAAMCVMGLDHVAFPTERPEELIAFYKGLGFTILLEKEWRAGGSRLFAVQCGDHKINVHGPELFRDPAFTLRGPTAQPGCGDLCFRWEGTIDAARALIEAAGGEVIEGPVRRHGGRATGNPRAVSVYTRDPDGNLLEFLVYDG